MIDTGTVVVAMVSILSIVKELNSHASIQISNLRHEP